MKKALFLAVAKARCCSLSMWQANAVWLRSTKAWRPFIRNTKTKVWRFWPSLATNSSAKSLVPTMRFKASARWLITSPWGVCNLAWRHSSKDRHGLRPRRCHSLELRQILGFQRRQDHPSFRTDGLTRNAGAGYWGNAEIVGIIITLFGFRVNPQFRRKLGLRIFCGSSMGFDSIYKGKAHASVLFPINLFESNT